MSRWIPAEMADEGLTAAIAAEAGFSPEVAAIVARRTGCLDAACRWLSPEAVPLCDPFAFDGMRTAVDRIRRALERSEPITVFGDYDTDGITAAALLVQALQRLGATVKPFFPDREREGYGLTFAALERCLTFAPVPTLIITVDCAVSSVEEVAELNRRGIDVIVTDHHVPPERLPEALAVINPRVSAPPAAAGLCGCATAFTVLRALATDGLPIRPEAFLDLVALATVADVMELSGDNRTLVARGLKTLRDPSDGNPGLYALAVSQRVVPGEPTAEQLAFGLVPCVNAAGRLNRLKTAYGLIGLGRCACAGELVTINEERRTIERALLARILREAPQVHPLGHVLIVGGEDFHPGVIGIVAARLMERVGVPVVMICRTPDGGGHGSMRSRGMWHAVEALASVADLLGTYGGHSEAAGFTLRPGAYDTFCERLPLAFAGERTETPSVFDGDLSHAEVTLSLCRELERLEPYGHGNPKPIFAKTFVLESCRVIGADRTHLQLRLCPSEGGATLKAVWFGGAERAKTWCPGLRLRAFFTLEVDTFREPVPGLRIVDVERL